MRAGEFTAVGTAPPGILLSEVAINSRSAPTAVRLRLHRAKTDPFGRGVEIFWVRQVLQFARSQP